MTKKDLLEAYQNGLKAGKKYCEMVIANDYKLMVASLAVALYRKQYELDQIEELVGIANDWLQERIGKPMREMIVDAEEETGLKFIEFQNG